MTTDTNPVPKSVTPAGTSPWVALLPLGFIAAGIGAIGFSASLAVRARPAAAVATPAPALAQPMSPREEARLAQQITAFALAKVAPERFEVDLGDLPRHPSDGARAGVKLASRKTDRPAARAASVLPPRRPDTLTASASAAPQRPAASAAAIAPPPALIPVAYAPPAAGEAMPGVLTQIASYVPSPRRILSDAVSDAWSLGGKVGKLIPGI